jgi:hypothetical protein
VFIARRSRPCRPIKGPVLPCPPVSPARALESLGGGATSDAAAFIRLFSGDEALGLQESIAHASAQAGCRSEAGVRLRSGGGLKHGLKHAPPLSLRRTVPARPFYYIVRAIKATTKARDINSF